MQKIARRKLAAYLAHELQSGAAVQTLVDRTAAYLIEQKQTKQLELLIRDVEASLADQYAIVPIRITSAHPLADATRQALIDFVQRAENATSVIVAQESTDPTLVGGVVLSTPNSTLDTSVRTRLRQLTATTKE